MPLAGRGARRTVPVGCGTALLLDESYNGNGASMRAALDVLRLQPARRRIAVLGDMLELGDEGPAEHAALAEAVVAVGGLPVHLRPADACACSMRCRTRAAWRSCGECRGPGADGGRGAARRATRCWSRAAWAAA